MIVGFMALMVAWIGSIRTLYGIGPTVVPTTLNADAKKLVRDGPFGYAEGSAVRGSHPRLSQVY